MKQKILKRLLTVGLAAAMAVTLVAGCGGKGGDSGKSNGGDGAKVSDFGWWISKMDDSGRYYEKYEECPVAQYVSQQYWSAEKGASARKRME